eukprot:COSAG03_NODE_19669_length_332_cov_1.008584_1_plen_69_part_10
MRVPRHYKRVCWAYYYWHVLGHPSKEEWKKRKDGTITKMCKALDIPSGSRDSVLAVLTEVDLCAKAGIP